MRSVPVQQREQVFETSQSIIFKRFRLLGFYPFIKSTSDYKMVVQLAHAGNLDTLVKLIETTAQLSFWEEKTNEVPSSPLPTGISAILTHPYKTNLTGNDLQDVTIIYNSEGKPQIQLEFTPIGTKKFTVITTQNVGKVLAIDLIIVLLKLLELLSQSQLGTL